MPMFADDDDMSSAAFDPDETVSNADIPPASNGLKPNQPASTPSTTSSTIFGISPYAKLPPGVTVAKLFASGKIVPNVPDDYYVGEFACEDCGAKYRHRTSLSRHRSIEHSNNGRKAKMEKERRERWKEKKRKEKDKEREIDG